MALKDEFANVVVGPKVFESVEENFEEEKEDTYEKIMERIRQQEREKDEEIKNAGIAVTTTATTKQSGDSFEKIIERIRQQEREKYEAMLEKIMSGRNDVTTTPSIVQSKQFNEDTHEKIMERIRHLERMMEKENSEIDVTTTTMILRSELAEERDVQTTTETVTAETHVLTGSISPTTYTTPATTNYSMPNAIKTSILPSTTTTKSGNATTATTHSTVSNVTAQSQPRSP